MVTKVVYVILKVDIDGTVELIGVVDSRERAEEIADGVEVGLLERVVIEEEVAEFESGC